MVSHNYLTGNIVFILGDYNINLLSVNCSQTNSYKSNFISYYIIILTKPPRFPGLTESTTIPGTLARRPHMDKIYPVPLKMWNN